MKISKENRMECVDTALQESRRHAERPHTFWDTQPVPSMSSELLGRVLRWPTRSEQQP